VSSKQSPFPSVSVPSVLVRIQLYGLAWGSGKPLSSTAARVSDNVSDMANAVRLTAELFTGVANPNA